MKSWHLGSLLLTSGVTAAILAGCAGGSPAISPVPLQPSSRTFMSFLASNGVATIYNFKGSRKSPSGANPNDLTAWHGLLYGTTRWGGPKANGGVFAMDTSGKKRVIYQFKGGADGMYPGGGVIVVNGLLYGTTSGGGDGCETGPGGVEGCGTVFSVTMAGQERVLHRFTWGTDGASPLSDLTILNGRIYGVTWTGGSERVCGDLSKGCGIVFEISASGKERIVYRFKGRTDGAFPEGTLLAFRGRLFGTTFNGGERGHHGCYGDGCGTVFELSPSGAEHIIYRFKGGTDGGNPIAGLTNLNDVLYGTTSEGGTGCISGGCGTVFKVTTSGVETVLYRFKGAPDGAFPASRLAAYEGELYGTTPSGGNVCGATSGYTAGTIFQLTLSGAESVAYAFKCWTPQSPGGLFPAPPLVALDNVLYGTTTSGGSHYGGTAFALRL
jgi:uncharacterized repeat protein (TIGR03803 family)